MGAYVLTETVGAEAARRGRQGRRRAHGRQGPRQVRRREGQLRAGLGRDRQGDRARRGLLGPPDRRRAEGARTSRPRTRRCGRSASRRCGRSRSRSRRSSTRSAGRCAAGAKWKEFGGSWIYGMNREGETPKVSIGFVTGLDYTDARFSVHDVLQEFKLHPLVKKILDGRQARRLGREGDPRGRLLGDADAARARHGHRRRRGRHGQRAQAQGHPLRDRVRPARGGDDLPAAQGRLERLLGLRERRSTPRRSARSSTSRAT